MQKLLTISIAAYNVEAYLEKTLQSLLCSEEWLDRLEVLIIDDASTDRTTAIAERYVERYPNSFTLISKENGGHGSTLNCSIAHATGKYYRFLDGDDWYDTVQLEQFLKHLERIDSDLVLTPFIKVHDDSGMEKLLGEWEMESGVEMRMEDVTDMLISCFYAHTMTVKTALLKDHNVHIPEHCFYVDNTLMLYMLLFSETVIKYDDNVYRHRIGRPGQSISDEGRLKHWSNMITVAIDAVRGISDYINECGNEKKRLVYTLCLGLVEAPYRYYFLMGDNATFFQKMNEFNQELMATNRDFYDYFNAHSLYKKLVENVFVKISDRYEKENIKLVLFGAGKRGKNLLVHLLRTKYEPCAITDNNSSRWGGEMEGIPVISPEEAAAMSDAIYLVAVVGFGDEIEAQLVRLGVSERDIYLWSNPMYT